DPGSTRLRSTSHHARRVMTVRERCSGYRSGFVALDGVDARGVEYEVIVRSLPRSQARLEVRVLLLDLTLEVVGERGETRGEVGVAGCEHPHGEQTRVACAADRHRGHGHTRGHLHDRE